MAQEETKTPIFSKAVTECFRKAMQQLVRASVSDNAARHPRDKQTSERSAENKANHQG